MFALILKLFELCGPAFHWWMRKAEFDRNKYRVSDAETDVIGGTTPPFSGQSHPRLTRTYGVVIPVTRAHTCTSTLSLSGSLSYMFR